MKSKILYPKPRLYETLLFIILVTGPPQLRSRDPYASLSGEVDWSVMLNAVIWGMAGLWVFHRVNTYLLNRRSFPRPLFTQWIALFFSFCLLLSTVVSLAPLLTAYRSLQVLVMMLFGFLWIRKYGIESMYKHLFNAYVVLCVAIALAALFAGDLVFAPYGSNLRLRGDLIGNTGAISAMGIIVGMSYPVVRNRYALWFFLLLFFSLLIMSMTRSAYAAIFFFLLFAIVKLPKSKPLRRFLLILFFIIIPTALAFQWMQSIFSWIIRESESITTLSDRIPLWEYTIATILERSPWLGVGFYANRAITLTFNPGLGTSHGAFVEVLSGAGIVGFAAFTIMLIPLIYIAIKLFLEYGNRPETFTAVSLLICVLSIGLVSEEMVIASPTGFTFWMLVSIIPVIERNIKIRLKSIPS
jgi:O-antigen ligase